MGVCLCVHTNNQLPLCGHKKIISKGRDAEGEERSTEADAGQSGRSSLWWLDENGPHKFLFVNAWSPVGGTVWEGLGGVALLKEVCHWGGLWSF